MIPCEANGTNAQKLATATQIASSVLDAARRVTRPTRRPAVRQRGRRCAPVDCRPRRSVPANIPRPPYAPDAPRVRAGGAARRDPRPHARRGPRRPRGAARGRRRGRGRRHDRRARPHLPRRRTSRGAATRAPLDYKGYPKSLCTSVNEVICHGIPDDRALQDGDIVNCDVTIYLHGVHGDCSETFLVGDVDEVGRRLVQTTYESPVEGHRRGAARRPDQRDRARDPDARGSRTVSASCARSSATASGETFHTAPSVPHFYDPHADTVIEPGMTFTIEPMINEGSWELGRIWPDGWTAPTARRLPLRAVRAHPARDADGRRGADAPPRRARELRCATTSTRRYYARPRSVAACGWRGERALVTGSTSGIGRAIAVRVRGEGAAVVVTGRDQRTRRRGRRRDRRRRRHRARSSRPTSATSRRAPTLVDAAAERLRRAHRAREQRGRRRRARRPGRRPHDRRVGGDPARRPHRADVVRARRDPAHAARRARRRSSTSRAARPNARAAASPRTSRPRPG